MASGPLGLVGRHAMLPVLVAAKSGPGNVAAHLQPMVGRTVSGPNLRCNLATLKHVQLVFVIFWGTSSHNCITGFKFLVEWAFGK